MSATLQLPAMRPPEAQPLGPGLVFALIAHALLVLALSLSVQWHSQTPDALEAEVWSAVPQAAAPKAVEPEPEPEPVQKAVEPPKPTGPTPEQVQAERDAEIAIAKAKAKKEADARAEAERKLQEKKELEAKKLKAAEKAAKDAKEAKEAKAREAKLDAMRKENLKRIQGMAGASGGPTATGNALQSAAPSAGYAGRIVARVRPNIIFSDQPTGNPRAEVELRVAPDGTIIGSRLVKASGDAEWDKAVLRAIEKTEMLPRDIDGRVPSSIIIGFTPRG
ncbi:MAG TPA: cell envelope integrity protein TolA [Burkholderiaceae bacterium]